MIEVEGSLAVRRAIGAATIGNALEWFDYIAFALLAGVIGERFFPSQDPTLSALYGFASLAVASLALPLGGVWFGTLADRWGRKRALVALILTMALATAAIGLTPPYAVIGVAAPLLLIVARLLQGFSAGGDFGPSAALLLEYAPVGRGGVYASLQYVAAALAFFVVTLALALLGGALSPEAMQAWGWRVPFLCGLAIAPIGLYLRARVAESPAFAALAREQGAARRPLAEALLGQRRAILAVTLIAAGSSAFTNVSLAYFPFFVTSKLGLDIRDAQFGLVVGNLAAIAVLLGSAWLSDRIGRAAVMAPAMLLYLIFSYFAFRALLEAPSRTTLWTAQAVGLFMTAAQGPFCALATEIFPLRVRSTGASIAYNLSVVLFGAFTPLIVGWLARLTGSPWTPFWYVSACIVLSFVGLALARRPAALKPGPA